MATTVPNTLQDGVVPVANDFMENFLALCAAIDALGGSVSLGSANQVSGVNSVGTAAEFKTVQGTANQVAVTHSTNAITLALTSVVAVATALAAGTNPADAGAVRLANDVWIAARNLANGANINMVKVDTSNRVTLGPGGSANVVISGQARHDISSTDRAVAPVGTDRWAV